MWQHNDLTQATDPFAPPADGDPSGYSFRGDVPLANGPVVAGQHVVYRSADDHIHELHWRRDRPGPDWRHNDLTEATDPVAPVAAGDPRGYAFETDQSQHVVYRDTHGHVHELHWKRGREGSGWRHNDLTDALEDSDAPLAASDPFGYAFESDESQHVVFRGADDHIYELHWKRDRRGPDWRYNDLTEVVSDAPLAAGDPRGYAFETDESQHVVYRGADGHIHELHWKSGRAGPGWRHNDLTEATEDPTTPLAAGDPFGYAFESDEGQHVVYRTVDGHVCELHWKRGRRPGWRHNDLTVATEPDAPSADGDPVGYSFDSDDSQHVVYRDAHGHVHELHWKRGREGPAWRHNDLTEATDPDAPTTAGDPSGYVLGGDDSQHVVYAGADDHVHELHWKSTDTTWFEDVLAFFGTVITGVVDFLTTIVDFFVEIVESLLTWLVSVLAFLVELVFSIPVLGRVLKWIWNGVVTAVSVGVGVIDFLAGLVGILPEKKLRVCVLILRDESGEALATQASIVPQLQNAIDIFWREANVRIIPVAPFQFDSGFAGPERATQGWIHTQSRGTNGSEVLDVPCEEDALREDLLGAGGTFELLATTQCFYGNARRVIGYGAPVVVFIVRDVAGTAGCSLGPLTDYVVVEAGLGPASTTMAHELGHACNLPHVDDRDNLMRSRGRTDTRLTRLQVAWLRLSRHVTYA